jgi:hypothetical protein
MVESSFLSPFLRCCIGLVSIFAAVSRAEQFDLNPPPGSEDFGSSVTVLPNGNFVVTDPGYDLPDGKSDAGAVYLYSPSGVQISKLTGSNAGDTVGSGGVAVVGNGNFVVRSQYWNNTFAAYDAGAVTWGSGTSGISGVVSAENSLVGDKHNDTVGSGDGPKGWITVLSNGNYVVCSYLWDHGSALNAGAVTWGDGNSGVKGVVSSANSIVGGSTSDFVGGEAVIALRNGNYVVPSPSWHNGALADVGAVTWGSGTGGTAGVVGPSISLVGSRADDHVAEDDRGEIFLLENGNYVVWSPYWSSSTTSRAGAITWCNGLTGKAGAISSSNSVVGTSFNDIGGAVSVTELTNGNLVVCLPGWDNGTASDAGAVMWWDGTAGRTGTVSQSTAMVGTGAYALVGYGEDVVTPLTNGNYVVASVYWHNGSAVNAGAVTWCNGSTGRTGTITSSNSLVGTEASTNIGSGGVTALSNGHYVVCSPYVKVSGNGHAGAATWCNGTTGRTGTISAVNSLVGPKASDSVGLGGATALPNGNYVVVSQRASNGNLISAGAVTWCDGTAGRMGTVSPSNSLVGDHQDAQVGLFGGVTVLANGHYVVRSGVWDNGGVNAAGAVTWCNGNTGLVGVVSSANSLVGTAASDQIESPGVVPLPNGNYVVHSTLWDSGPARDVGAVTWCSGTGGTTGPVNLANSLVGSTADDQIGYGGLVVLPGGDFVVRSYLWDNGAVINAGAVTRCSGGSGVTGAVSAANSLVGTTVDDRVGEGAELVAADGSYLFSSPKWNAGASSNVGAVMMMPQGMVTAGGLSPAAGVPGGATSSGSGFLFSHDPTRGRMFLAQPQLNLVSIYSRGPVFSATERFAQWADGQGLAGEDALPDAKPTGDEVPNLLKYSFNLGASSVTTMEAGGLSGLPLFTVSGDTGTRVFRLEYLRRVNGGLIYRPMISGNLGGFDLMTGAETVSPIDAGWERVVVEQALGAEPPSQLFGRVEVDLP